MHLHILGISGTFMSAIALLARDLNFKVTGSDTACYPPISDLLTARGITWTDGYDDSSEALNADLVIVGNAIKRGMPVIEAVLNARKPYISGPEWLAQNVLSRYKVMAVAGTHGKTTTTAMLAFILDYAGLNPGFLIGGVAANFNTSNRLGGGEWFVIEADEYDTAFFDKRPKFMHYRPSVAILNNLEFDHADIYSDLPAIEQQFHYLLRTIPQNGVIIKPRDDSALNRVLARGEYSRVENCSCDSNLEAVKTERDNVWHAQLLDSSGSAFNVLYNDQIIAEVQWSLMGRFNVENALCALAASTHAGVDPKIAAEALQKFIPVKRRLEVVASINDVTIYDDFAHHPTAIKRTIQAVKDSKRHQRIVVVLECASYTMRSGVHANSIGSALAQADAVYILEPSDFSFVDLAATFNVPYTILPNVHDIVRSVVNNAEIGDAIVVMSNRGFAGVHKKIADGIGRALG